jgi:hypothetical protein
MTEYRATIARDAVREAFEALAEAAEYGDLGEIRKAEKALSIARKAQRRVR